MKYIVEVGLMRELVLVCGALSQHAGGADQNNFAASSLLFFSSTPTPKPYSPARLIILMTVATGTSLYSTSSGEISVYEPAKLFAHCVERTPTCGLIDGNALLQTSQVEGFFHTSSS